MLFGIACQRRWALRTWVGIRHCLVPDGLLKLPCVYVLRRTWGVWPFLPCCTLAYRTTLIAWTSAPGTRFPSSPYCPKSWPCPHLGPCRLLALVGGEACSVPAYSYAWTHNNGCDVPVGMCVGVGPVQQLAPVRLSSFFAVSSHLCFQVASVLHPVCVLHVWLAHVATGLSRYTYSLLKCGGLNALALCRSLYMKVDCKRCDAVLFRCQDQRRFISSRGAVYWHCYRQRGKHFLLPFTGGAGRGVAPQSHSHRHPHVHAPLHAVHQAGPACMHAVTPTSRRCLHHAGTQAGHPPCTPGAHVCPQP